MRIWPGGGAQASSRQCDPAWAGMSDQTFLQAGTQPSVPSVHTLSTNLHGNPSLSRLFAGVGLLLGEDGQYRVSLPSGDPAGGSSEESVHRSQSHESGRAKERDSDTRQQQCSPASPAQVAPLCHHCNKVNREDCYAFSYSFFS